MGMGSGEGPHGSSVWPRVCAWDRGRATEENIPTDDVMRSRNALSKELNNAKHYEVANVSDLINTLLTFS